MDRTPVDVLERLIPMLQAEVDDYYREGREVQMILSTKPKGKMRELNKKANEIGIKLTKAEGSLKAAKEELEGARKKK